VDDAEAVAAHPEEEALLALGGHVHARVEEGAQQAPVAQKDAQELVVVDVYVVEPRRVEKVVAVNEYRYSASVTQLPGDVVSGIIIHAKNTPSALSIREISNIGEVFSHVRAARVKNHVKPNPLQLLARRGDCGASAFI
jgi:hypothetical protein